MCKWSIETFTTLDTVHSSFVLCVRHSQWTTHFDANVEYPMEVVGGERIAEERKAETAITRPIVNKGSDDGEKGSIFELLSTARQLFSIIITS